MPPRKPKLPDRIGAILDKFLSRKGWKSVMSRHRIVELWPEIVDERVASHAQVEHVSGSVVHIIVDSAVWMNELSALKTLLLEKINARLSPDAPPFTEIRFSQRSWAGKKHAEAPITAAPVPSPTSEEIATMTEALEPVEDDELRTMLARIIEKNRQLQHRRHDED